MHVSFPFLLIDLYAASAIAKICGGLSKISLPVMDIMVYISSLAGSGKIQPGWVVLVPGDYSITWCQLNRTSLVVTVRREGIAWVTHIYKDMRRSSIHCWLEMIKSHHVSENSTTAGQLKLAGLSQYLCDDLSVGLIAVDQTDVDWDENRHIRDYCQQRE